MEEGKVVVVMASVAKVEKEGVDEVVVIVVVAAALAHGLVETEVAVEETEDLQN